MSFKTRIRIRKLTVAACGLIFGGAALHVAQTDAPRFIYRIKNVQQNLGKKIAGNKATRIDRLIASAWANNSCDGTWTNSWSNGAGGFANATCDGSWSNSWTNVG